MASSLSSILDNFAKGIYNSKCKYCKTCLKYVEVNNKLLILNCLKCNKTIKYISKKKDLQTHINFVMET